MPLAARVPGSESRLAISPWQWIRSARRAAPSSSGCRAAMLAAAAAGERLALSAMVSN